MVIYNRPKLFTACILCVLNAMFYSIRLIAISNNIVIPNNYRDALCLGESRDVALDNFRGKLSEALRNSWSVSLNWYFHNVARAGN